MSFNALFLDDNDNYPNEDLSLHISHVKEDFDNLRTPSKKTRFDIPAPSIKIN